MKPLPKEFLLSRGSCCKNGCQECPYGYNKNKNMKEKEKYYTPDIEDLRIGYKCEVNWARGYSEEFEPLNTSLKDEEGIYDPKLDDIVIAHDDGYAEFRTPFLTKEDIESEGWVYSEDSNSFIYDIKNIDSIYYTLIITGDKNRFGFKTIEIQFNSSWNTSTIYYGLCPSVNEFRTIMKLLNIKQYDNNIK